MNSKKKKIIDHKKTWLVSGDETIITIDDLNHQGQGIGHVEGLTVFVDQAIPGDTVNAVIRQRKAKYAVASLKSIVSSSPDRIEPDCPQADRCGGCTLQTMKYEAQLKFKVNHILNALQRIGHMENLDQLMQPIIGMDNPWQYRSKAQCPIAGGWQHPQIGFYESRSHHVVDAPVCAIQPSVCDAIRQTVRHHIKKWRLDPYREEDGQGLMRHLVVRMGFATGDIMVILVVNGDGIPEQDELIKNIEKAIDQNQSSGLPKQSLKSVYLNVHREATNVVLGSDCRLQYGSETIEEQIMDVRYHISPLAFFQVNPTQTEKLYAKVLEFASLNGHEQVLDLYCGTGSITLQLAKEAGWVLGIESHPAAIQDAIVNAQLNNITNVEFIAGQVEAVLPSWLERGLTIDLVVLDPPRKGCDPHALAALKELSPDRIIYVSCNPATLARDLAELSTAGYKVKIVQPVDLFPWTSHVETVVLLERSTRYSYC